MYEFHYDYMKKKYNSDRLQLCYMDMDLLVYSIETEDFYTDITDDVPTRFNASSYIRDHPLPIGLNKKVIGLMTDELGGAMTEFIALRPKLYSYRKLGGICDKKCKGIKKCVVKRTLTFEDYKNCLLVDSGDVYRLKLMFRLSKHEVHTIEVNKVTLNRDDDNRISKKDGISTLARRHKSLSWNPITGELSLI